MKTYRWYGQEGLRFAFNDGWGVLGCIELRVDRWCCDVRGPAWHENTEAEARTAVERVLAERGWTPAGEGT